MPEITIRNAQFPSDTPAIRALIGEYIASIDLIACRDEVEAGLREMPKPYYAAGIGYFLAENGGTLAGGAAFARIDETAAEMARLFVRPEYRRAGVARALATHVMRAAAAAGYRRMVLLSLPEWRAARTLYGALEFAPIPHYEGVAVAEALCFARDLS